MAASATGWAAPRCSLRSLAQGPATHRTHPTAARLPRRAPPPQPGNLSTPRALGQRLREGRQPTMTDRERDLSLQACSKGHVIRKPTRYGTKRFESEKGAISSRRRRRFHARRPDCLFCPPSHSPSGQFCGVGRQNWVRGRIPIFRKIHLYGKSAKSTHGHQTARPISTFFFRLRKKGHGPIH